MYTPSILDTPLRATVPVDAAHPADALTADWPMLDDGQVQIGVWQCTPGRFNGRTGAENESNAHAATLGQPTLRTPITGYPHESSVSLWTHDALDVGVWQCTPGEFTFRRDGYDEVFCVLSGHATLHLDGAAGPGQSFQLVPGAAIVTPAGSTGRWVVHDTMRKAYTIVHR